jgi:hypothetical protein
MSMEQNVRGVKCPGASYPLGELSMGRAVPGASCPWGKLSMGRIDCGASCRGASCRGASCLWGEFRWGELSGNLNLSLFSCLQNNRVKRLSYYYLNKHLSLCPNS